jgi:hypothetical protein
VTFNPRKIGTIIWNNKERLVLVIMVGVLCYRVYEVINPPPPVEIPVVPQPRNVIPNDWKDAPPVPTPIPTVDQQPPTRELVSRNPFSTLSGGQGVGSTVGGEDDIGLQLLGIKPWSGGTFRAQVITKGGKKQYVSEGEEFEEFRIISIDKDAGTVRVFSEKSKKSTTLKLKE